MWHSGLGHEAMAWYTKLRRDVVLMPGIWHYVTCQNRFSLLEQFLTGLRQCLQSTYIIKNNFILKSSSIYQGSFRGPLCYLLEPPKSRYSCLVWILENWVNSLVSLAFMPLFSGLINFPRAFLCLAFAWTNLTLCPPLQLRPFPPTPLQWGFSSTEASKQVHISQCLLCAYLRTTVVYVMSNSPAPLAHLGYLQCQNTCTCYM